MIGLLAQGLVFAGVLLLIGALVPIRRLIGHLSARPERKKWYTMSILIVVFIAGYLCYAGIFWDSHSNLADLIVPGVFFFGSCFVWLTGTLSLQTTETLITLKDAAEKAHLYLKAIWDTIPSGVVVIDQETHQIVDANPFAQKLMDRTQAELIGRECHSFICPAEKGKCPITDLGQKVDGSERKLVKTNGETIEILKTVLPFSKRGGNLLIESFTDISELKKTQERLKASGDVAEAASRAKSEFLASMSHELRTPLNHIIGFTDLVLSRNFGELSAEQEDFLKDVLASSHHLLSLINDVLDLSKVEAGKMELELSEVRIGDLLENSLVMVKEKAIKQDIRLVIDVVGVPEVMLADERKIKQVVYNLLSNAVKFTPAGGEVRLGAKIQDGSELDECPIARDENGRWLSIWVSDTGIGIEQQDLARIFNPFEQVESSTSRKYQGTGLGLALTRKMVELHSGAIWAESGGDGKGSTFRLAIPVQDASGAGDDSMDVPQPGEVGPKAQPVWAIT
jgi:PAS domain S-box-containing protein